MVFRTLYGSQAEWRVADWQVAMHALQKDSRRWGAKYDGDICTSAVSQGHKDVLRKQKTIDVGMLGCGMAREARSVGLWQHDNMYDVRCMSMNEYII
jgi:hypothetical protein